MKYCYQCGCALPDDAKQCPVCGEIYNTESEKNSISIEKLSRWLKVSCFIIPVFGWIWAFIKRKKAPFQARKAVYAASGGALVWLTVFFLVFSVWLLNGGF